jgi:hypothetical protein
MHQYDRLGHQIVEKPIILAFVFNSGLNQEPSCVSWGRHINLFVVYFDGFQKH